VEWPAGTFASPNDPIEICIVGQNPFGPILDSTVRGKKIGDRAFTVQRLAGTEQATRCQILFIGGAEWRRTPTLLEAVKGADILTVGESDDFTAVGGIVGFKIEGPRIRIRIALETAEHTRLRISSKLLSLAEIVKRQP